MSLAITLRALRTRAPHAATLLPRYCTTSSSTLPPKPPPRSSTASAASPTVAESTPQSQTSPPSASSPPPPHTSGADATPPPPPPGATADASTGVDANSFEPGASAEQQTLDTLHAAVLDQVAKNGWTSSAIPAALRQLDWSPASAKLLPSGLSGVLARLEANTNRTLAEQLAVAPPHAAGVDASPPQRAAFAIASRLLLLDRFRSDWRRALMLRTRHPTNALRNSMLLADEIAHFANYTAPDVSWYADRALLSAVFHAAELYWLTDQTPDATATTRFVYMRLNEAHALKDSVASSVSRLSTLSDAAAATVSTLIRSRRPF